jgi:hypothetical protein
MDNRRGHHNGRGKVGESVKDEGARTSSYLNPKFTLDVSFLLATVLAGAAIVEALTQYGHHKPKGHLFELTPLLQALIVVLTTLRFFSGNVLWNYINYDAAGEHKHFTIAQRAFQRFSSYYVHIFQYVLFFMAAIAVGDAIEIAKWLLLICATDVVWTASGWSHAHHPILRRALCSWTFINLGAGALCALAYFTVPKFPDSSDWLTYALFAAFSIAAVFDYAINANMYFGYVTMDGRETN